MVRRKSLVCGVVLLAAGGCAGFRNPFIPTGPPAPQVLRPGAAVEEVIAAVNANTARVQTYSANGATIRPTNMPGVPALSGGIMIERPFRFRVYAGTALTGPEIDLGTNDELVWMWLARSEPPAVYVCRRDQFAGSQAQQFMPIDPDWLPSAMGLVEFAPHGRHQMRVLPDQNLEIASTLPGPGGVVTRICVIDPTRGFVLEQHVYDGSGTPVATAVATSHRYFPEYQVSLPQHVEVRIPRAQLALAIDVGQISLNTGLGDPGQLWLPPQVEGYPHVELGARDRGLAVRTGADGGATPMHPITPPADQGMYVPKYQPAPPAQLTPGQIWQPVYRTGRGNAPP